MDKPTKIAPEAMSEILEPKIRDASTLGSILKSRSPRFESTPVARHKNWIIQTRLEFIVNS
jgi:hypothetical protein